MQESQKATMPSSATNCALCGDFAVLRESHIVPAFVYRWLKDTSATGYLRAASNPSKRVQDGLKQHLLCAACEGRFAAWETEFATRIFYPYNADDRLIARYGDWMLKFCVSMSWRALKHIMLEANLDNWTAEQRAAAHLALERWRAFLFGEVPHPGPYEQHLLPLTSIASSNVPDLPNNMNRYLMRAVEIDAPSGKTAAYVFAKMGRFALFGFVVPPRERWKGTRVGVKNGTIKPSRFAVPADLGGYFCERAQRSANVQDAIPDHQHEKIEASIRRDPSRFIGSDEFAAMMYDARMFGEEAILRKPKASRT